MKKEIFVPLNNHVLFKEVEEQKSGWQAAPSSYTEKVPRGKVVTKDEKVTELQEGDDFLYRKFHEIRVVKINGEDFSITKFENIYGKFL